MPSFNAGRDELPSCAAPQPAQRRPHICFVAPHFWPVFSADPRIPVAGGAEVQQCRLARLLVKNGYTVSVICEDYGQPPEVFQDGIRIIRSFRAQDGIPVLRFIHPRLTSVWRALHKANADIYYLRGAGMSLAIITAFCRRHGKRSIFASASDADFDPGRQMIDYRRDRWLYEMGLARADAIVVQNETQRRMCHVHYGRDATLIPSLYDLPDENSPAGGDSVLWVASIRHNKRPELLLEMARALPQRRFVMIGGPSSSSARDHQYFASISHLAAELPNIEFLGFKPLAEVEKHFDRARVFVNTSRVEGLPNTFLQAWARGVPTIAFDDSGAKSGEEQVHPIVTDTAQGIASIERFFADLPYHQRVSERCREHFNNRHGSHGILAQYQKLIDAQATSN